MLSAPLYPVRPAFGGRLLALGVGSALGVVLGVAGYRAFPRQMSAIHRAAAPVAAWAARAQTAAVKAAVEADDEAPASLIAQRALLFREMQRELELSPDQMEGVEAVFSDSPILGQGNPYISRHPMSRAECRSIRAKATDIVPGNPRCGAPNMVPLFDPERGEKESDAKACIDQLEFPNIPCAYPVVHVRANEAAELCQMLGKRLCDAHEWEGACAGDVRDPNVEYGWGRPRTEASADHNASREKVWSYGPTKNHALCATGSTRTEGCPGGGFDKCGSNTYPTGAFPLCKSPFGAYDLHGNVAEHMNIPVLPQDLTKNGGAGFTEMKGSWFAFGTVEAHPDDCRWRAPDWHDTRISNTASHANYHLGFRCCKDLHER